MKNTKPLLKSTGILESAFTQEAQQYLITALKTSEYFKEMTAEYFSMTLLGIAIMIVMGSKDYDVGMREFEGKGRLCLLGRPGVKAPEIDVEMIKQCDIVGATASMLRLEGELPESSRLATIAVLLSLVQRGSITMDSYNPEFAYVVQQLMMYYSETKLSASSATH